MKKLLALCLVGVLSLTVLTGCASNGDDKSEAAITTETVETEVVEENAAVVDSTIAKDVVKNPKYVFLFIGDGMTYPQFQATASYLGAVKETDDILDGSVNLSFMDFPVAGSATTFDSTSFCPDSASTATSLSTGFKTYSGVINMDESLTKEYKTISEMVKEQLGYKVGIVSSVNINHATPAAFYAHQPSRNNYYEIGVELIESGFDYFAGGALKKTTGYDKENPMPDLYELANEAGYQVVMTQAEAETLTKDSGKVIAITENLADSDSMDYEIDREDSEWSLADYVEKGIEVLDNETGFFMMVEGGKIDWACHANDAGSTIQDVLAFDDSVKVAIEFMNSHPDETLIIVTGDHETGGLSIGFAGTNYDTYLDNIVNQKISYAKFDEEYVASYVEKQTSFADAMKDVTSLFGLLMPETVEGAETLVLNEYELSELQEAYEITLAGGFEVDADGNSLQTQEEYVAYGSYTPFTVTVTHLLNNKSGINFASYSHTGLPIAVFASGNGQEQFNGSYDNTDIYKKMAQIMGLK